jgi:hypothetical protein
MPKPLAPTHSFSDLNDFLLDEACKHLDQLEEDGGQCNATYAQVGQELLKLEAKGKLWKSDLHCLNHELGDGSHCRFALHQQADEEDNEALDNSLKCMVVGSTCVSWSVVGKRKRAGDKTMRPFLIFLFLVRKVCPDILLHECTAHFDCKLLVEYLGHLYRMVWSTVIAPELFGVPVKRDRRYSLLINISTVAVSGSISVDDMEAALAASRELDGNVFFAAGDSLL